MKLEMAVAANCSAMKKHLAINPIKVPVISSVGITITRVPAETDDKARARSALIRGERAAVTANAMKSLTFIGTRGLEKPGASIMQPPTLQNSRKSEKNMSRYRRS